MYTIGGASCFERHGVRPRSRLLLKFGAVFSFYYIALLHLNGGAEYIASWSKLCYLISDFRFGQVFSY